MTDSAQQPALDVLAVPATDRRRGIFRRCWYVLGKPSARFSLLALVAVGFFSGIIFWGGFNTVIEATNTMEFCVSCHEMQDTVYQEYQKTVHYSNRSGVRAICSDCHVPKDWVHKMARKIQASGEIYGKLTGSIDTPEKLEAKRLALAGNEWNRMKLTDSRECRNCHSLDGMSKKFQTSTAWRRHKSALKTGETCIDCHKGVAHRLPAGVTNPDDPQAPAAGGQVVAADGQAAAADGQATPAGAAKN